MIEFRTFFNYHKTSDLSILKKAYETWKKGAINVPSNEKAYYYYEHFVISGITLIDFMKLVDD